MKVTMSRSLLEQARETVLNVQQMCRTIDAQIEALPEADPVMDGKAAVDKRAQAVADLNEEKERSMTQGATAIQDLRDRFVAALLDAATPKGDDLSHPDYILIRDCLVDSPEQLVTLLAKHDNFAFARAAQNYADARKWEGFDEAVRIYRAVANAIMDFGKAYFDLCDTAVYHPAGMAVMQIGDEDEITRMAKAYGVLDNLIE